LNLSRKEVGRLVGLSSKSVARNERRLGLTPVRINRRVVLYPEKKTIEALKRAGLDVGQ